MCGGVPDLFVGHPFVVPGCPNLMQPNRLLAMSPRGLVLPWQNSHSMLPIAGARQLPNTARRHCLTANTYGCDRIRPIV